MKTKQDAIKRTIALLIIHYPNDECVDESQYYIIKPNEETGRIVFKPKDVKNIIVAQKKKVNAYYSQHGDDTVDEYFLTGVVNSLK